MGIAILADIPHVVGCIMHVCVWGEPTMHSMIDRVLAPSRADWLEQAAFSNADHAATAGSTSLGCVLGRLLAAVQLQHN